MIIESLSFENKIKFRELAKKFHPDINKEPGSEKIMQRLNSVKDDDKKFIDFYNEIMGIKNQEFDSVKPEIVRPAHFKTDKEWKDWHEKVKAARRKRQEKERKRQRGL